MSDIIISKTQSLQRCVERARQERRKAGGAFPEDFASQDAAVLNVLRACELAIDLANYIIKTFKMGVPASSGESFELLARKNVIPAELEQKLKNMVGFRNIAVHEYQKLEIQKVEQVIDTGLGDLIEFTGHLLEFWKNNPAS